MKVLVTGASGLVGRRLVPHLLHCDMAITAFVRDPAQLGGLKGDRLTVAAGHIEDSAAVARAVAGCEAVVHLANASGVTNEARVYAVNVRGTEHVLAAARAAGVRRIVFTSTVSAVRERLGPYGRSKRRAEELVRASQIPFVVLRPSLVYGDCETGLVASLLRHLRALPIMPVIGDGQIQIDPLHVDDLCAVIDACLVRNDVVGHTYDVLGPDRVTLDDLLRRLASRLGVNRPLVHIPAAAALPVARLLGRIMTQPPLTVDNILGLTSRACVDPQPTARDFPLAWTSLDDGLRRLGIG